MPRGVPGLELGFARFIHVPNRPGEPSADFWRKPFKVFFLKNEYAQGDTLGADNQLASAFFRWVFPHSGFEFYGERGYEDQFYDLRDFIEDPDHERAYMLGFQKTLHKTTTSLDVLKMELINYQWPTIERVRFEGQIYLHGILRQGHTNRDTCWAHIGRWGSRRPVYLMDALLSSGRSPPAFTFRRIDRGDVGDFAGTGVYTPSPVGRNRRSRCRAMRFGRRVDYSAKIEAMQDYNLNLPKMFPNLNLPAHCAVAPLVVSGATGTRSHCRNGVNRLLLDRPGRRQAENQPEQTIPPLDWSWTPSRARPRRSRTPPCARGGALLPGQAGSAALRR